MSDGRICDPCSSGYFLPNATTTTNGCMSAADKAKLNSLTPDRVAIYTVQFPQSAGNVIDGNITSDVTGAPLDVQPSDTIYLLSGTAISTFQPIPVGNVTWAQVTAGALQVSLLNIGDPSLTGILATPIVGGVNVIGLTGLNFAVWDMALIRIRLS